VVVIVVRALIVLGILGGFAACGGFLVAASGIIPITASGGHFAITEWILQFSKERSVATHTIGMKLPPLAEPALVLKGAGHYETACRPCHGSPEHSRPVVPNAMLPPPPYLPDKLAQWEPEELFYIVKHGIKFTGMPAWPTQQRDDEVEAMVAFLIEFPKLDAAGYRRLVHGDAAPSDGGTPLAELARTARPPAQLSESCVRCHGRDGRGRSLGAFPSLAGQRPEYAYNALAAYARGERPSALMQPIAAGLSEREMRELARHYAEPPSAVGRGGHGAGQRPVPIQASDSIRRGREIAENGVPAQGVPSCVDCHGPEPSRPNPAYPLLAGQHAEYLVLQLELLKAKRRGGSSYAHLMLKVAPRLSAQQIRDVAQYYASLPTVSD
jgi:cytochrome c553